MDDILAPLFDFADDDHLIRIDLGFVVVENAGVLALSGAVERP